MQLQREQEKSLNEAWMERMSHTDAVLREKMTLFWHNHFACRSKQSEFAQQLNNIHRENALGNFRTLLQTKTKTPTKQQKKNNQQNHKNHPKKKKARELME